MVCYLWDYLEVARLVVLLDLAPAIWSKLKLKKKKKKKQLGQFKSIFKLIQIFSN